jgi:hypothetical protein
VQLDQTVSLSRIIIRLLGPLVSKRTLAWAWLRNILVGTGRRLRAWNLSAETTLSWDTNKQEEIMGRGLLLWLIGIPIPIILLIWLFGGLH